MQAGRGAACRCTARQPQPARPPGQRLHALNVNRQPLQHQVRRALQVLQRWRGRGQQRSCMLECTAAGGLQPCSGSSAWPAALTGTSIPRACRVAACRSACRSSPMLPRSAWLMARSTAMVASRCARICGSGGRGQAAGEVRRRLEQQPAALPCLPRGARLPSSQPLAGADSPPGRWPAAAPCPAPAPQSPPASFPGHPRWPHRHLLARGGLCWWR